jgi:hypothetical protein
MGSRRGRTLGRRAAARLFCAFLASAGTAALADDYSAWAHRQDIYYDTSPDGAGVPGDVAGFPVLVRLDSAGFPFSEARGDGRDLRFSKPDGTPLPFAIDVYDSAARTAAVWVLADTVKGNHKGPLLRMYWGNASAAAPGDSGKVFARANGFAAVWHLRGRYPTARANAVPGGFEAVPQNYDNDEQTPGVIGYADSLDGGNPGDYLQTWEAFDSLSRGFTFSIWAYPTSVAAWGRFMDFGNGAGQDNLVLGRVGGSDSLGFENWSDTSGSRVAAPGAIVLNEWQQFAVTVTGKTARLYRNGAEIAAGALADTLLAVRRQSNYLGRGNWPIGQYYRGKLDEPEVSATVRGPDWIKLAYANQRPDQKLLSLTPPIVCEARFGAPGDTAVPEGTVLGLSGTADCSDQYGWSWAGGLPVRILDPEAKSLSVAVPRAIADTAILLRFSARFGDSVRSRDVRIAVKNVVPQPKFALPSGIEWNGRDTLVIGPVVANLAALRAGPFALHPDWTVAGPSVDTAWKADTLLVFSPQGKGALTISLCLDNGGPPVCDTIKADIADPVGLAAGAGPRRAEPGLPGYRADGRFLPEPLGRAVRFIRPAPSSRH